MNRFYYPSPVILGDIIVITDKDKAHHIKRVLCLRLKEEVVLFDKQGIEYHCVIQGLDKEVTLRVIKRKLPDKGNPGIKLTLACAIPKKGKFDDIIDKLTQLGVDRIIPLISKRVLVKLDRKKQEERLNRWKRIAESASQQSQRNNIPLVGPIKKFDELLAISQDFDLKLIPTLGGARKPLQEVLAQNSSNILVLIGPEGDFSEEEVIAAKGSGFIPVSLGELVLRVDTAAISAAAIIRNKLSIS